MLLMISTLFTYLLQQYAMQFEINIGKYSDHNKMHAEMVPSPMRSINFETNCSFTIFRALKYNLNTERNLQLHSTGL